MKLRYDLYLAAGIGDLVRSGVGAVLALEPDPSASTELGEAGSEVERGQAPAVDGLGLPLMLPGQF